MFRDVRPRCEPNSLQSMNGRVNLKHLEAGCCLQSYPCRNPSFKSMRVSQPRNVPSVDPAILVQAIAYNDSRLGVAIHSMLYIHVMKRSVITCRKVRIM